MSYNSVVLFWNWRQCELMETGIDTDKIIDKDISIEVQ